MTFANTQYRKGLGPHSTQAANFFAAGKIGDTCTREQMSDIIGRPCDPSTNGYANVLSACGHVERELGIIWAWVRAEQVYRCLSHVDRLEVARARSKAGTRRLKTSNRAAGCIDESELSKDDRHDLKMLTIQNSLALTSLSRHLQKRLDGNVKTCRVPDYDRLALLLTDNGKQQDETRQDATGRD